MKEFEINLTSREIAIIYSSLIDFQHKIIFDKGHYEKSEELLSEIDCILYKLLK